MGTPNYGAIATLATAVGKKYKVYAKSSKPLTLTYYQEPSPVGDEEVGNAISISGAGGVEFFKDGTDKFLINVEVGSVCGKVADKTTNFLAAGETFKNLGVKIIMTARALQYIPDLKHLKM